MQIAIMSGLS